MNLTTFIVMGVVMGLLFVGALVAVFWLNRHDRADNLGVYRTGQPGQHYGQQAYAQHVQGQYGQQPQQPQYGQQQPQQYGQQQPQQYGPS